MNLGGLIKMDGKEEKYPPKGQLLKRKLALMTRLCYEGKTLYGQG
jgi:hypothetical protein